MNFFLHKFLKYFVRPIFIIIFIIPIFIWYFLFKLLFTVKIIYSNLYIIHNFYFFFYLLFNKKFISLGLKLIILFKIWKYFFFTSTLEKLNNNWINNCKQQFFMVQKKNFFLNILNSLQIFFLLAAKLLEIHFREKKYTRIFLNSILQILCWTTWVLSDYARFVSLFE